MAIEEKITNSEEETIEFGFGFAKRLKPGDIIALYGELGAGKTEFVKGICSYFDVEEMVASPTFTIINQYFGTHGKHEITIYHIDLYRIKNLSELDEIGFTDCLYTDDSIKIIEWAEKAKDALPSPRYDIHILTNIKDERYRKFSILSVV